MQLVFLQGPDCIEAQVHISDHSANNNIYGGHCLFYVFGDSYAVQTKTLRYWISVLSHIGQTCHVWLKVWSCDPVQPLKLNLSPNVTADRGVSEAAVSFQRCRAARRKWWDVGGQLPSHPATEWPDGSCRLPVTLNFPLPTQKNYGPTDTSTEGKSVSMSSTLSCFNIKYISCDSCSPL